MFIAAAPQLRASLREQFEALGGYSLHALDLQKVDALQDVDRTPPPSSTAISATRPRWRANCALSASEEISSLGAVAEDARFVAPPSVPFRGSSRAARDAASSSDRPDPACRTTEKEAAILSRLAQADGAVISKAALLADVWGYGPNVSTRTLETHIHRLRQKIEIDPRRPQRLLTEEGGYRLAKSTDNAYFLSTRHKTCHKLGR